MVKGLFVLMVVQVVNDEFFVAARRLCKLDALLHLAVSLKQVENCQVVYVVVVVLQKLEELLLENFQLLLADRA